MILFKADATLASSISKIREIPTCNWLWGFYFIHWIDHLHFCDPKHSIRGKINANSYLETIRSHKSRAGIPSNLNPASRKMISDFVELYETEVCFLHIPLIGTNVWLPNMQYMPLRSILSLQDLKQSQSPETVPTCIVVQCFPHDHIAYIHLLDECKKSNEPSLCHKLGSIWWLRASLFTDHGMYGLPIRAKCRHFRTIWEHNFDISPTDPNSSSLNWWSSMHGVVTWYNCWCFVRQLAILLHTFLCMTFHITGPWRDDCIKSP